MAVTMTMHDQAPVTGKDLRVFGLMMGLMIALVFGLVIPWLWSFSSWPLWPWLPAAGFALWGLAAPTGLAPVYRGWMKVAGVLGWINTRLILALAFYVVIFPIGMALRALGKDPMARRLEHGAESYRVTREARDVKHMERPY